MHETVLQDVVIIPVSMVVLVQTLVPVCVPKDLLEHLVKI